MGRLAKRSPRDLPSQPSVWRLASIEVESFARHYRYGSYGRACLRAGMLAALLLYERRTHPSGMAVCLLGKRRLREAALIISTAFGTLALGALSRVATGCVLAVLGALFWRPAIRTVRALPRAAALRRAVPPGQYKYVHSLASTAPGAGAELLRALTREADKKGWSLLLDASNEKLACYYATFGFVMLSRVMAMPDGTPGLRMWRPTAKGAVNE
jgi:hypothetical protein